MKNQSTIILEYLEDCNEWKREGEITGIRTPRGDWIGYRGPRDVRQLIRDGKVDSRMNGKFREVRHRAEITPKKVEIQWGNYNVEYPITINKQRVLEI